MFFLETGSSTRTEKWRGKFSAIGGPTHERKVWIFDPLASLV